MHRILRLAYPLLLLISIVWLPVPVSEAQPHADTVQPLDQIIGKPVATETHLFWLRPASEQDTVLIVGYDLKSDTQVVLQRTTRSARSLVSDGRTIAWIERTAAGHERIQGFDLRDRQPFTLMESSASFGGLALNNGMLVYQQADADRQGLFLRIIATGEERQISAKGQNPVAADGTLLWTEEHREGPFLPTRSSLYMQRVAGGEPTLLADTLGAFISYSASGDYVTWAAGAPAVDRRVYLHQISANATQPISSTAGSFPIIQQSTIAWTTEPDRNVSAPRRWTIQAQDIGKPTPATVITATPTALATWAITNDGRIVVTADESASAASRPLYLVHRDQRNVRLPGPKTPASVTQQVVCEEPLQCGQVRIDGTYLVDDEGRWPVNGVQFFLPQYGINTWTFHDGYYWNSTADIDRWLDVARDHLDARLLRIFVELPTGSNVPTSHATIYDFATRANTRRMRVGLVLQNSSDFRMTTERRAWLNDLIGYFEARGALALIAYASAANEINNWCATQDCYDNNAAYVDAANEWVAQFTSIFRSRNSRILTTVGIATEVQNLDGRPAWYDFFQPDTSGRSLAQLVDFLSPHNYGGGGYGIINDLRYVLAYNGPVVLEEYGFPTDPKPRDVRYSEGPTVCRDDPWHKDCTNTAPFFVEWSTRAIRETSYAGGVAWMLADNVVKRCGSDPPDLWTGLFATTGNYCGGTYSTEEAKPKATAHRVKLHHAAYPPPQWKRYLPIISKS